MTETFNIQSRRPVFAGGTHVGLCREINEDNFCYINFKGDINQMAVVADGIGGHRDGQFASMFCCRFMMRAWRQSKIGSESDSEVVIDFLKKNLETCNHELYELNQQKTPGKPMGTTVVAAVFMGDKVVVAHAGDSRMYMCEKNSILQWTTDHSLVMELVRQKIITPEEMGNHPYSNVILSSIGPAAQVKLEINIHPCKQGQRYVICSDGLTRHNNNAHICEVISAASEPKVAMEELIRDTLLAGAEDNVALICIFNG